MVAIKYNKNEYNNMGLVYLQIMPSSSDNTTENEEASIQEYLSTMTDLEKKAYAIAKEHLESSFDISKSNGYKAWIQKKSVAA